MSRSPDQHTLDRAVISVLRQVSGRLVPEDALISAVEIKTDYLAPSRAEIEEAIRYAEREGRALGVTVETGKKYKITEAGEAWALEVKL
ncbi:MAG TPA: hypothetical protein VK961_15200 [Chthoniobacter sp.]|nr:hypothetical protein [Chthoniobacter sp.]